MSLVLTMMLIAITWLMSTAVDVIPHLLNGLMVLPLWMMGAAIVGLAAWITSEP
ncbi:MAG: hypothetical protein AAGH78_04030 [Cyanobacteria bacterium P01_H01_bin.58]